MLNDNRDRIFLSNLFIFLFLMLAHVCLPKTAVVDLGERPGGLPPPPPLCLFWVKKEEMTEGRKPINIYVHYINTGYHY